MGKSLFMCSDVAVDVSSRLVPVSLCSTGVGLLGQSEVCVVTLVREFDIHPSLA